MIPNGSVWWQIKNVATGEYLDGLGSTSNGSPLAQWSSSGSTNQYWALEYTSSGYYKLINETTGLAADNDGLTGNGTYLQQWGSDTSYNQQWTFTP
jgi:endoglucanase